MSAVFEKMLDSIRRCGGKIQHSIHGALRICPMPANDEEGRRSDAYQGRYQEDNIRTF
jgi:hypothetical protein